jgi:hypothetical protein
LSGQEGNYSKEMGITVRLSDLKRQLLQKEISEEEYKKKKDLFTQKLFELYCKDIITIDELEEKLK